MDVDQVSFYPLLLDILTDISESHFVAVDLELSGVPSKNSYGTDAGKPSLQQRYLETKEAAERYQILQIGITCVEQDLDNGKYILKPYNFDLSPVIQERGLDVERIFSFQSGAVEFLLKVGFDMNRPFARGVPYLSRAESKVAREKHSRRQDKSALADIQLKPTETDSLAFLERVRHQVNAWVRSRIFAPLEILSVGPDEVSEEQLPPDLSRFEKRLVHQLIRAEYPELVTIGKRGHVQIVRFDKEREDRIAAERKRELEERISRQKGFRWIIEALLGSNIGNIDFREVAKSGRTGEPIFADFDQYKAQFNRAQARIRGNPRILIGHNCFLDMVYIYRTFIGKLPDTVEGFQSSLHELWPVVIDTKYLSTHNCGDINPISSLEQIAEQLQSEETPPLETDQHHSKYDQATALHEAGYDSFLTAQVALRLSTKLEREGAYIKSADKELGVDTLAGRLANVSVASKEGEHSTEVLSSKAGESTTTRSHTKMLGETNGFTPSIAGSPWRKTGDPTLGPLAADDVAKYSPRDRKRRFRDSKAEQTFPGGMPHFGSDFWRVYGNKMRVFGTEEGMCVLDRPTPCPDSEDGGVGVS